MTHSGPDCPLCQDRLPDDFVRKIKSAKSGKPMTVAEFMKWLNEEMDGSPVSFI